MARNKSHLIARLTKAREQLVNGRWRRYQLVEMTKDGKVKSCCAMGALTVVDPRFRAMRYQDIPDDHVEQGWTYDQSHTNRNLIGECADELNHTTFGKCGQSIIQYNDAIARSKRDVVRVFDDTIKRLQANGPTFD